MSEYLKRYFNFIRQFIPAKSVAPAVGIDMGAGDCKMVEIIFRENQFFLNHWDTKNFGDDAATSLKSILDGLEVPTKSPNIAVFGKGSLIRYVELPRMTLDDLKKSFAIESDKYFPFEQDQIYTDCAILDPDGKGKKMMVIAAAARREIVDEQVALFEKLGLHINIVSMNAVVLLNVINRLGLKDPVEKDGALAVLDMGESVSSLSILVNNVPWFSRDIFIGGKDFTKKIQSVLGVGAKEAEELKKNPGEHKDKVQEACDVVIASVLQEIQLSFDYFNTDKNRDIKKLLLTGGGSMLTGIVESFEKNVEIPVVIWNPFENVVIPENLKSEFEHQALRFGVALGLALYDYD